MKFLLLLLSSFILLPSVGKAQEKSVESKFVNTIGLSYCRTAKDNIDDKRQNLIGLNWNYVEILPGRYFMPAIDFGLGFNLDNKKNPMAFFTIIPGFNMNALNVDDNAAGNIFIGSGMVIPFEQGGKSSGGGIAFKLDLRVIKISNFSINMSAMAFTNTTFPSVASVGINYIF